MGLIIGGVAIIVLFFAVVMTMMVKTAGWKVTLTVWGCSFAATAMLIVASMMIAYGLTGSLS